MRVLGFLTALGIAATAAPSLAVPIAWTDWTAASAGQVVGTITTGSTSVGVIFTGAYSFAQTAGGANYWSEGSPPPYTGGNVSNAPPDSDIIGLSIGGTATITFDQAVLNPVIALVSWNGNVVNFNQTIETVSAGRGYWGAGSFTNVTPTGFTGAGELHGIVRIPGVHSSISFTHTSESWHGLQVGAEGTAVPLPLPLALLGSGMLGLAVLGRTKRA